MVGLLRVMLTIFVGNTLKQLPCPARLLEDDCLPTAVACSDDSSVTEATDSAAVPLCRLTLATHPPDRYM